MGYAVAQLVEALCYKPEGRGFDSRWCHWNFSLTQCFRPHYGPGVDSATNRNGYQENWWKLPTSTHLRATWHTDSLDMVVPPSNGASRYHNCCIDGGTSPEYFGYHLVFRSCSCKTSIHRHNSKAVSDFATRECAVWANWSRTLHCKFVSDTSMASRNVIGFGGGGEDLGF
jgi:hypothetical protein